MPTVSKKATSNLKRVFVKQRSRLDQFMARRPHRSFRLTRRRDYLQPLVLPGLFAFTKEVTVVLWRHKRTFLLLGGLYALLFAIFVGGQSEEAYVILGDTLKQAGGQIVEGGIGVVGEAALLLLSVTTGSLGGELTEAQQLVSILLFLMIWLTTVWLLRNILAGHKVKLRDGLYSAGAPLFATIIIAVLITIQLLPVALAAVGYSAALVSGLLSGGVATMLFWLAAGLLSVLSLYWITSSLFALIIITVPGMYPYKAIVTAGDLVVGRRLKVLLRWAWMILVVGLVAFALLVPIILLDMWLKQLVPAISGIPIVPFVVLLFTAYAAIWMAGYVYLLYRKVVDYVPAK